MSYINQLVLLQWLSDSADLMYSMYMQTSDVDYETEYWIFVDSWTFINSLSRVDYRIWFFQHNSEIENLGYPGTIATDEPVETQLELFAV